MANLGIIFTRQVGVTQASKLNFNSLCHLDDGTVLGASTFGVAILDYGDDDAGADINAFFEFPSTDFGVPNQKKLRKAVVALKAAGNLKLSIKADDGNFTEVDFFVDIDSTRAEGVVVPFRNDVRGRFLTVKIENTNGCDFSINSVDVELMLGTAKAGRIHHFGAFVSEELPMMTCEATGS